MLLLSPSMRYHTEVSLFNLANYMSLRCSGTWYTRFEPQLYLYGKAAGVVSDLVVWHSGRYNNIL